MVFIAVTVAMSRLVAIKCPHCGHQRKVERRPVEFRICPCCHKRSPDPLARKPARRR